MIRLDSDEDEHINLYNQFLRLRKFNALFKKQKKEHKKLNDELKNPICIPDTEDISTLLNQEHLRFRRITILLLARLNQYSTIGEFVYSTISPILQHHEDDDEEDDEENDEDDDEQMKKEEEVDAYASSKRSPMKEEPCIDEDEKTFLILVAELRQLEKYNDLMEKQNKEHEESNYYLMQTKPEFKPDLNDKKEWIPSDADDFRLMDRLVREHVIYAKISTYFVAKFKYYEFLGLSVYASLSNRSRMNKAAAAAVTRKRN